MWCPRCDQGEVVKAKIRQLSQTIYICEECEAVWFAQEAVGVDPFVDYGQFMQEKGLEPFWDELDNQ